DELLDGQAERQFVSGDPAFHDAPLASRRLMGEGARSRAPSKRPSVQRPRLFLTAGRPGWPSKVVTPASQASSEAGLAFSHSSAALGASSLSLRILFITVFSMSTVNFR